MSTRPQSRLARSIIELILAPVVALAAFRALALLASWAGRESAASALVTMLYSAPTATVLAFVVVLFLGMAVLRALHGSSPPPPWSVVVARAVLPLAVVLGLARVLPTPALIVAGVAGAVLAGQALARTRLGEPRPPRGSNHVG